MKRNVMLFLIVFMGWSGLSFGVATTNQVDVSGQVALKNFGYVLNRSTGTFDTTPILTNSMIPISGPLSLVITEISNPSVKLINLTGLTQDSKPFINVPVVGGVLAPGSSVKTLLKFSNPQKIPFTFKTQVLAYVQDQITDQSITTTVDSKGSIIDLPGKALLVVPPGSVKSAAIQMSVIDLPEFDELTSSLGVEVKPLTVPRLKIKSSTALLDRILLRIDLPEAISSDRDVALYAIDDAGNEAEGLDIEYVDGFFCDGKKNSLCAWIHPSAFSPVPLDPLDPMIKIAAATVAKIKSSWQLFKTSDIKPDINSGVDISIDGFANFSATVLLEKNFSFTYPLPDDQQIKISGFKILRRTDKGLDPHPHNGVDLATRSLSQKPETGHIVVSALAGVIDDILYGIDKRYKVTKKCPDIQTSYMNRITVRHDKDSLAGLTSQYLHINEAIAYKLDLVPAGDFIAVSGEQATCGAPHLHFQVSYPVWQRFIDPWPLLQNDMSLYLASKDSTDQLGDSKDAKITDPNDHFHMKLSLVVKPSDLDKTPTVLALDDKDISKLSITYPESGYGKSAKIKYSADNVNLNSALGIATGVLGAPSVKDLLNQRTVQVKLEMCTFRLGIKSPCHDIAIWTLKPLSYPPLSEVIGSWAAYTSWYSGTPNPHTIPGDWSITAGNFTLPIHDNYDIQTFRADMYWDRDLNETYSGQTSSDHWGNFQTKFAYDQDTGTVYDTYYSV